MNDDDMVGPKVAAHIVDLSPSTLAKMRCRGDGPPYYQPRRKILYLVSELKQWRLNARRTKTPDNGGDKQRGRPKKSNGEV
jgi:hypothetical protein